MNLPLDGSRMLSIKSHTVVLFKTIKSHEELMTFKDKY